MVGAVNCPTCPNIVGIAPIVPIVPDLKTGMHHMMQAYGGWTFAFKDYIEAGNLTSHLDDPSFASLLKLVDPVNYVQRLERLPKFVLVSSDDEFMMMEWTQTWWDKFTGEKHLMIANNAEHSMATGIVELLQSLGCYAKSLFLNGTRPTFDWSLDLSKGTITVRIPPGTAHTKVVLRHAHTMSTKRRDFRWVSLPDSKNGTNCTRPEVGPVSGLWPTFHGRLLGLKMTWPDSLLISGLLFPCPISQPSSARPPPPHLFSESCCMHRRSTSRTFGCRLIRRLSNPVRFRLQCTTFWTLEKTL